MQVVIQIRDINARLETMMARLSERQMQLTAASAPGAAAAAAAAAGGGGVGGSSPVAFHIPGSAMAGALPASALAVGGGAAFRPGLHRMATVTGRRQSDGGGLEGIGGAPEAAAVGEGGASMMLVGALAAMHQPPGGEAASLAASLPGDSAATVAATIMGVATSGAKAVVERWRHHQIEAASDPTAVQGGGGDVGRPRQHPHGAGVQRLVTGCVATLLTLQQCTSDAVSPAVVEAALDAALRLLAPHARANPEAFAAVSEHVKSLRTLLAGKA